MPSSAQAQQDAVSDGIENFELPRSLVTKIAKSAVPEGTKLQKDTVLSLVKGSTVFINYLAAIAHDVAQSKQHKSVSASDVLRAIEMCDFADLIGPLQAELKLYREGQKGRKNSIHTPTPPVPASAPVGGPAIIIPAPKPAIPRLKGKERATESASVPLPTPPAQPIHHPEPAELSAQPVSNGVAYHEEEDAEMHEAERMGVAGDDDETEDGMEDDEDEVDDEEEDEEEEPEGATSEGDIEMGGVRDVDAGAEEEDE